MADISTTIQTFQAAGILPTVIATIISAFAIMWTTFIWFSKASFKFFTKTIDKLTEERHETSKELAEVLKGMSEKFGAVDERLESVDSKIDVLMVRSEGRRVRSG